MNRGTKNPPPQKGEKYEKSKIGRPRGAVGIQTNNQPNQHYNPEAQGD